MLNLTCALLPAEHNYTFHTHTHTYDPTHFNLFPTVKAVLIFDIESSIFLQHSLDFYGWLQGAVTQLGRHLELSWRILISFMQNNLGNEFSSDIQIRTFRLYFLSQDVYSWTFSEVSQHSIFNVSQIFKMQVFLSVFSTLICFTGSQEDWVAQHKTQLIRQLGLWTAEFLKRESEKSRK